MAELLWYTGASEVVTAYEVVDTTVLSAGQYVTVGSQLVTVTTSVS
jgi:hypothetical protein